MVPFHLLPYLRHLKRLVAGPGTLKSAAYRQELLYPEEKASFLPAIYLEGQLERVTNAPLESTRQAEIAAATQLTGLHSATIAYHFRDVALVDGSVYVGTLRFFLTDTARFLPGPHEVHDFEEAALVSSFYGMKYFGHWLRDDCCKYILATERGFSPLSLPLSYPHANYYQSLFRQQWSPTVRARIGHLTIFEDYSQNDLMLRRYRILRDYISQRFGRSGHRHIVYLKRGKTGSHRVIQNEDVIIEALAKRGCVIVDMEAASADQIIAALVSARTVISMEGSHISPCAFALPLDSGILILQPPDRFTSNHREWANCLGIQFGFVVGNAGEAGYFFDTSEVLRTLDLMLASIAA